LDRRHVVIWLAWLSGNAALSKASAQQPAQLWRIGFLGARSRSTPANPDAYYDAFVRGMRELGYVEGSNLAIEWRFADGKYERLPGLAAELVQLKIDVLVTHGDVATPAAKRATSKIPIVMAANIDPVGAGLIASLARPGGNITGMSITAIEVQPKQLELLKAMIPGLSRVAFVAHPDTPTTPEQLKSVQTNANQIGISVSSVLARTREDIERGFVTIKRDRADAVIVGPDSFFILNRQQIADLALKNGLPSMFPLREQTEAGGLMSYGVNIAESYRHAAVYVDKILKGAKPSELPVEQPTKYDLVINKRTAKALGLTIPRELLLRADEVIE
jgi:putative ABC transport system substrate-binding protein